MERVDIELSRFTSGFMAKKVTDFDQMTDISKNLRSKLKEIAYVSQLKIEERRVSEIDDTVKYLFFTRRR